jgi:uncharacterized repeat protein (TIGR03803 family)
MYGTTSGGGAFGYGTVYKITTDGKEKLLYSFGAPFRAGLDGWYPYAA